jgi:hypothetical protein
MEMRPGYFADVGTFYFERFLVQHEFDFSGPMIR